MTKTGWTVAVLATAGMAFTIKAGGCLGGSGKAPDEKLASKFNDLCAIAKQNVETPERGVRRLGAYFGKHAGDMMADWGNTFATIETIADDAKHDARARVARDRIRKPLFACARDWMEFSEAIEASPEATALITAFNVRFNRTIEIIFGERQSVDLLHLPQQLLAR